MRTFIDTNIFIYAQSNDDKGEIARQKISRGAVISVQVLNEVTNVLRNKQKRSWHDIEQVLADIQNAAEEIVPLTLSIHSSAVQLARDHNISIYDALIIAAALDAKCVTLFSEDLQNGRKFGRLEVVNPFG